MAQLYSRLFRILPLVNPLTRLLSQLFNGVLYNLHPGLLAHRSSFFNSMFSLPRGPDAPAAILTEGKIDTNPIKLPSCISQYDFDNLLIYLYMGPRCVIFLFYVIFP